MYLYLMNYPNVYYCKRTDVYEYVCQTSKTVIATLLKYRSIPRLLSFSHSDMYEALSYTNNLRTHENTISLHPTLLADVQNAMLHDVPLS